MRVAFILLLLGFLPAGAAELTLDFALRWQGALLAVPSSEVLNAAGQQLRLTRFALLISGVTLRRDDGSAAQLDGQHGFIDAETGRLAVTLRNVPAGDYTGLEFQIGLPAALNHADPAQWPAGHPLNPIVNRLHWGWTGGYVFAAIEGRWRSAGEATERGFSYHLATDARVMRVGFVSLFRVEAATRLELAVDVGKILSGTRLAPGDGSETTHSASDDVLAPRLAVAVERAFFFLEAKPVERSVLARRVEESRVTAGTPLAFAVPPGFPPPELPADNPLTGEGVALGELLFNDPRLSAGRRQSCAGCHQERRAFSDSVALSLGVDRVPGTRNAMPLFNLAWSPAYAWDGSKPRIRDQVLAAMTNPIEMHAELPSVVARLQNDRALREKFAAAFGSGEISAERVLLALEQYLLTLVSGDSKLNRALRGEAQLSADEQRGFELFITEYDPARGRRGADCFHCHGGVLFTDFGYRDNGIGGGTSDGGRGGVNGRETDRGKFKTPSLRNVALTAPYMHDGRFATLEDVVAHYDHGVRRTAAWDPNLAKHPNEGLQLGMDDQRALVAFLRTLTDARFQR